MVFLWEKRYVFRSTCDFPRQSHLAIPGCLALRLNWPRRSGLPWLGPPSPPIYRASLPLPPLPLQHSVAANICKHRPCNDIWLHGSLRVGGGQCNTIVRQNSSLADNNSICQYHSAQSRPPYYPDCTGWWLWPSQWTMDPPKTRTMGWSTYFHSRDVSAVHEFWGPQTISKWNQ